MSIQVVFWDVQHGNAAYIQSPNGRNIVVDLGTGSYSTGNTFSPLNHLRRSWDVQRLDYVVITHPHKDHIDDIFSLDGFDPKVLLRPRDLSREDILSGVRHQDLPVYEKYLEIDGRFTGAFEENDPDDPSIPDNYGGMVIKTFSPHTCSTTNINNHSCVVVMSYASSKIVFTGDNETCSFEELLNSSYFVSAVKNADVLLAPHHGRESGFNYDFASLVNPRITVISDGRFCDTSATSRYRAVSRGWKVHQSGKESEKRYCLTTRNDGAITVSFGFNDGRLPFLDIRKG